ncbi:Cd(II)/Pb(II)-responsive transcriptional regulator [Iodobacter sp. CM08]|uniref:Cd(II)/Pb(II)-responsive transcriptional regulator n=1 Tax=Iodobacter sp. CM08 TaxID=3085902 RepID=UPI00298244AE|nr:Cd(II)/Pb(II)-responsive transcriptional regulator [Iodobacter sp. CM08]MDW5416329.1 Cd(II)/Pb(II)-responsive transcriptional regulator [Iodobacter sp. CM08]
MKIGELALAAQCTVETIRYYEKEALLPEPARTSGNYRDYSDLHLERLSFIRNCRALDMTHQEIKALLALMDSGDDNCASVNTLLDAHIEHVSVRIAELLKLELQLKTLRQQCQSEQSVQECGIVQGLNNMEVSNAPERHTHLG